MFNQRKIVVLLAALSLTAATPIFAQEAGAANQPGQPEVSAPGAPETNPADMQEAPPQAATQDMQQAPPPAPPPSTGWRRFGSGPQAPPQMAAPLPEKLTLPAGSWITIRVDQPLSSDHNQPGDFFAATLAQPLIVDGIVVARRGQMVGGAVSEAVKAGRAKGVSRLGLELTELSLVDGRQVPVKTQLVERRGDTSVGRDAAAIGTTTAVGAGIGAAAAGGFGAGVGAGAGAVASTVGVLLTRGRPTVVYPEMPLTFRLQAPVTISTIAAPDAFQPVTQADYGQRMQYRTAGPGAAPSYYYASPYGYPPYGYYPYSYGWGYPYWYGPSLYFGWGGGFYRGWGGFGGFGGFRGFHR